MPRCPIHKCEMRPSRYTSGWYCPNKIDGQWCTGSAARYRCEECGATLLRPHCPSCDDDSFIVAVDTGMSVPNVGTDGMNEDHYGHG